jgi:hypothetical protein
LKRFLVLPVLLVAPFLPMGRVYATTSPGTTVTTTAHGITLTMVVPRRVYAKNALVRLTVHVRNVSRRSVLTYIGAQCTQTNPFIEVLDSDGDVTSQFPQNMMVHSCPIGAGYPLPAGASRTARVLFVLNGVAVRAVLNVGRYLRKTVITPSAPVGMSDTGPAPPVVHRSADGSVLSIERPAGAVGPLYLLDSTLCGPTAGTASLSTHTIWTPVEGNRISSGCLGPQHWSGFAGYLNYPVVTIDYSSP